MSDLTSEKRALDQMFGVAEHLNSEGDPVDPLEKAVFELADEYCPGYFGPMIILCNSKGKPYKSVTLADYVEAIWGG